MTKTDVVPDPNCLSLMQGQSVLVGLSGGRDSVALLLLLQGRGVHVHALHVHHGIRGAAADADAAFCRALCERKKIPFAETRVDVPALAAQRGESLETAARTARRAALAAEAQRLGTRLVALAHHADDNAETVLFRLARGSAGLRGMQPVHEAQGICWLRPLLHLRRADLTRYLQEQGERWVEDASNAVPDVARNALRLTVIPALNEAMGRDTVPVITRSAQLYSASLSALETALSMLPLTDPQGRLYLPALDKRPRAFRCAVLHRYLTLAGVPDLSEELISAVENILSPDSPTAHLNLPGNLFAHRREKRLLITDAEHNPLVVPWEETSV